MWVSPTQQRILEALAFGPQPSDGLAYALSTSREMIHTAIPPLKRAGLVEAVNATGGTRSVVYVLT